MFKDYDKSVHNLLSSNKQGENWESVLEKHTLMLARIQHERLIHLMIMIFVGISMLLSTLATLITLVPALLLLDVPLLILFVAYIFHYRFLENTTQAWYLVDDTIRSKIL